MPGEIVVALQHRAQPNVPAHLSTPQTRPPETPIQSSRRRQYDKVLNKNSLHRFIYKRSQLQKTNTFTPHLQPAIPRTSTLPFKWWGGWAVGGGDVVGGEARRPWGGALSSARQHHACRGCLSGVFGTNAQRVSATRPMAEHRSAVRAADHRHRSRRPWPSRHATAAHPAGLPTPGMPTAPQQRSLSAWPRRRAALPTR